LFRRKISGHGPDKSLTVRHAEHLKHVEPLAFHPRFEKFPTGAVNDLLFNLKIVNNACGTANPNLNHLLLIEKTELHRRICQQLPVHILHAAGMKEDPFIIGPIEEHADDEGVLFHTGGMKDVTPSSSAR